METNTLELTGAKSLRTKNKPTMVGCFALVDAFHPLEHQLKRISEMGFKCADITDTHPGALLGGGVFDAAVSFDDNPFDVKRMFEEYGLEISTLAAHAHLLDPSSPARFGNSEVMKSVKLAYELGIKYVITTEHEITTPWARKLTRDEQVFITAEKLWEPVRMAHDMGITILLEPHGPLTDSVQGMRDILERLDNNPGIGVCLDTGNSWLGGADPVEMAREFKHQIKHIHWKDLTAEMIPMRGIKYGCGFSKIALGQGVIDIKGVWEVLKDQNISHSTLEIVGEENLLESYRFLKGIGAAE